MIFPTLPRRREACATPRPPQTTTTLCLQPYTSSCWSINPQSSISSQPLPFYKPQQPLLVFFFNPFILILCEVSFPWCETDPDINHSQHKSQPRCINTTTNSNGIRCQCPIVSPKVYITSLLFSYKLNCREHLHDFTRLPTIWPDNLLQVTLQHAKALFGFWFGWFLLKSTCWCYIK